MPRVSPIFRESLKCLDFDTEGKADSHLLYTAHLGGSKVFHLKELFTLKAAKELGADAVYFRRFADGRSPMPQIFIYDNSKKTKFSQEEIAVIHRNIWSSCIVPIFLVIDKTTVDIYDCRKPVDIKDGEISSSPIETLGLADEAVKQYSAQFFDNGTFWEQERNRNRFTADKTAYIKLIGGLKNIKKNIVNKTGLDKQIVHKLLVRCILIKYLEERGNSDTKMFAKEFFQKKFGTDEFCRIIEQGKILEIFDKLGKHFNGGVFAWPEKNERNEIAQADLSGLAEYLDGKNTNDNLVLWAEYSFKHLPVELISSIYEAFLKSKTDKDIVYTPEHLVSLIVDESMSPDDYEGKENFKVIDGTCGSGIFLVKAFKRMVQWWRYKNYVDTGILRSPPINSLLRILRKNIFGVELKQDAAQLAIFSLAVALCDELTPKQIWHELKFEDLSKENILNQDFFDYLKDAPKGSFDLVLGNPPFGKMKKDEYDKIIKKANLKNSQHIPRYRFPLLYLETVMFLLKPDAKLALIMPAGPLLYNETLEFRKVFFSRYNVEQILDFTNLSSHLFQGQANVAAVAFYVTNKQSQNGKIAHITIGKTKTAKERIYFEIDHYDFHWLSNEDACDNPHIWKANLLGGGRVLDLIQYYDKYPKIGAFLKKKERDGWISSEGYKIGHDGTKPQSQLIKEQYDTGEHLRNKPTLVSDIYIGKKFTEDDFQIETNKYFGRERKPELFIAPFILLKEVLDESGIPMCLSNTSFIFKEQYFGISAPESQRKELESFFKYIEHSNLLFRLLITIKSGTTLVNRASVIQASDIKDLPCFELDDGHLSYFNEIIKNDISSYIFDYLSQGQNSIISQIATHEELEQFSEILCRVLNSIYEDGKKKFRLNKIIDAPTYYACEYELSKKEVKASSIVKAGKDVSRLESLLIKEYGSTARITRVVKLYEKDKFYLIKPKALRYWLKSIALRDADELFADILEDPNEP